MSYKDVQESQHRFTQAKKPPHKRGKTTFLDEVNISQKDAVKNNPVEFHFKERGVLTNDTESSYAMRREYPSGAREYFVKFATAGAGVGRMLNPWGTYYQVGDDTKYESQMGRKRYEFRSVPEHVFDTYLQFLQTQSERYILVAEREVNNAS